MSRKLQANIIKTVGVQAFSVLIGFFINIFLPKLVDVEQYANLQLYFLYGSYAGLFHFGLLDGILIKYAKFDYESIDKEKIRSQLVVLLFVSGFASILFFFVVFLLFQPNNWSLYLAIAISIVVHNVFSYVSCCFQMVNRINGYNLQILFYRIIYAIIVFAFLFIGVRESLFFCFCDIFSLLLAVLLTAGNIKGLMLGKITKIPLIISEARDNIRVGYKILIVNLSFLLLFGFAQFYVQKFYSLEEFGKTAFAFKIINVLSNVVLTVSAICFPALKRIDDDKAADLYHKLRINISPLLLMSLMMYFPMRKILLLWLPKYSESVIYIAYLLPTIVFSTIISIFGNNYLRVKRKEQLLLQVCLLADILLLPFICLSCRFINGVEGVLVGVFMVWVIFALIMEYKAGPAKTAGSLCCLIFEFVLSVVFMLVFKKSYGMLFYAIALLFYIVFWYLLIRRKIID